MIKRESVAHKLNAQLQPLYYPGPLASTYSLWLWDGIRGLVADSATEGHNWVVDQSWTLSSTWGSFPAASNDRRHHGALQPAGHVKRISNVGEQPGLAWGPESKLAWADQHILVPSQLQINLFQSNSSQSDPQKPAAASSDVSGMTGVFNGNTPLQITVNPDKRFKSLPPAEILPRNTTLGGYIFVCNNDTMQEDLKRQLFGMIPTIFSRCLFNYQFNGSSLLRQVRLT